MSTHTALCPKCGYRIPSSGSNSCSLCGALLLASGSFSARRDVPWERVLDTGVVSAFVETLSASLLRPRAFFDEMRLSTRTGSGVAYALVVGALSACAVFVWSQVLDPQMLFDQLLGEATQSTHTSPARTLLLSPLTTVLGILCLTLYTQAVLTITRSRHAPLSSTLRLVCYGQSAGILLLIPVLGPALAAVWGLVLLVVGVSSVHRISTGRAAVALGAPLLILGTFVAMAAAGLIVAGLLTADLLKEIMGMYR